ncbi:hypothetical protein DFJ58DRAFT_744808 [Suillus subalutaceus]|uniref:uncharacterized protein n=1 Tax=Suillus subalutaceus TaxID=48586 RepID=UPI001B86BD8B|nr:uncharacterized protein DFJ58DRAFT_744808 [Suillus subalutaceus]KAG1858758.1 hypothetical protein DFJ58DRAFT_744808 [Suillus subalutaceus]
MQTVNSNFDNLSSASDIIDALQNILRSQVFMPDLDIPYSRASVPNINHPTIEPNSESISAILTERQQQLDAVLRDISGLETVIDGIKILHQQLVDRKEKIIQSMTFHKGLRSALWRLPTEVLSQIFHQCLPEDKYLSPASNRAPMLLTRICRPWRDVAVDMPSLWCRLHVNININKVGQEEEEDFDDSDYSDDSDDSDWEESVVEVDRAWQRAAFCYDSWLKRSQGHPLSLVLGYYHSTWLLRSLLQPYSNQILSLSINFSRRADGVESLLKDVPALQELVTIWMGNSTILTMAQSISQIPSTMRVLDVMNLPFNIRGVSSLNPVWAHLTQVKINLTHPDAFLHLLRLCPNLSSLTVLTIFHDQRTLEPFTHTNIQSLYMSYHNSRMFLICLAGLFDALSFPNLRVFEAYCAYNSAWPHEQLMNLFARSKCPLERLIFGGRVTVTDVPRAEYVALIPSLDVVVNV